VGGQLRAGVNVIEAEVENQGGAAGFLLKLVIRSTDGKLMALVSDENGRMRTAVERIPAMRLPSADATVTGHGRTCFQVRRLPPEFRRGSLNCCPALL
jgi:hypothetical protein